MEIKKITERVEELHTDKLIITIVSIVALIVAFQFGEFVGYSKARFSMGNESRYYKNFDKQIGGDGIGLRQRGSDSHGVVGKVLEISDGSMTIADRDGSEKVVGISKETIFRQFRNTIRSEDVSSGDFVVVIGSPDLETESRINAKLIRVMPTSTPDGKPLMDFENMINNRR